MASIRAAVALLLLTAGLAVATPVAAQGFSGDVNVILRANGILDVIGDNEDNRVTLCQNPDDAEEFSVIIIYGDNQFRVETVNGVTRDVRFIMRGGDDVVQINGQLLPPADCDDVYPPPPPPPPPTTTIVTTTTTITTTVAPTTTAPTTTSTVTTIPTTDTTSQPPPAAAVGVNDVCAGDEHGCHHEPDMLFPRDLRVLLGSGSNTFSGYEFGVVDDLTVRGGSSYDEIFLSYVNIWDRADINAISGGSSIRIRDSYFGRSSIRASTGLDRFSVVRTDLGDRPMISTGASDDVVRAEAVQAEGRWTINTGGGKDLLSILTHGGCGVICNNADHVETDYQLNVIMGAQDDTTEVDGLLEAGDRLNGGSGSGDRLYTSGLLSENAVGGPTINGYEFIGPFLD